MSRLSPILVKIGGALVDDAEALAPMWDAIRHLRTETPVVVVHGGGPQSTALARRLGHEPRLVHGRRVTTDLDLDIALWSLRGALNARLVAQALQHDLPAVGVSSADARMLRVSKRPPRQIDGEMIDFGWVGEVEDVQPALLVSLLENGYLPVVAPLGIDAEGRLFNVNADTVATSLAGALGASALLLVTESGGVRKDGTLLQNCDVATFESGVAEGWIHSGMRVKLQTAFEAHQSGIPDVFILAPEDLLAPTRTTRIAP